MRGTEVLVLAIVLSILFSLGAVADEASGRTSDGCSYKVINGQYLTSCPKKGATTSAPSAPVQSYSDVPVRHNEAAPQPTVIVQQPTPARVGSISSALVSDDGMESTFDTREEIRRERLRSKFIDQTYAGVLLGASNMKASNAGSSVGVGLNLGTNINDTFGVELGYTYAKQKLRLDLASRNGGLGDDEDPSTPSYPGQPLDNDSTLASHLITAEVQAHLTDPVKRLRPYLGAGLGWRSSTLREETWGNEALGQSYGGGGSLHQNSLGGIAAAGTKLRIAKAFHLGFAFRYFFPITSQDARIEQPVAGLGANSQETQLSQADDSLTSSSQYQVLGGLQFSF